MKNKNLLVASVLSITGFGVASAANVYAGSEYLLSTSTTWDAAEAEAVLLGGHLVAINDAAEQTAVIGFFGGSERFWIGLNDFGTEGVYEWTNGDPVIYTNWNSGEPNNLGNEDAVAMNWAPNGPWNDWSNNNIAKGIIELPITPIGTSPIPEPNTALGLSGLLLCSFFLRRRRPA